MIVEPICFICAKDGTYRLDEPLPPKTVIDVHMLARLPGTDTKVGDSKVFIEARGRAVVYERIGVTIEGHWICRLRVGGPNAEPGDIE